MKLTQNLFFFLITTTIISQNTIDFGNQAYFDTLYEYNLFHDSGIEVSNCDDIPELWVIVNKKSSNVDVELVGCPFDCYEGDEVKVKIKYRDINGNFGSSYEGYDDDVLEFNSYDIRSEIGTSLKLQPINSRIIDMTTKGFNIWDQIYFEISLNGESKVFRYKLEGYKEAFKYLYEKYQENINPFQVWCS